MCLSLSRAFPSSSLTCLGDFTAVSFVFSWSSSSSVCASSSFCSEASGSPSTVLSLVLSSSFSFSSPDFCDSPGLSTVSFSGFGSIFSSDKSLSSDSPLILFYPKLSWNMAFYLLHAFGEINAWLAFLKFYSHFSAVSLREIKFDGYQRSIFRVWKSHLKIQLSMINHNEVTFICITSKHMINRWLVQLKFSWSWCHTGL